jgi:hypothetical protein
MHKSSNNHSPEADEFERAVAGLNLLERLVGNYKGETGFELPADEL